MLNFSLKSFYLTFLHIINEVFGMTKNIYGKRATLFFSFNINSSRISCIKGPFGRFIWRLVASRWSVFQFFRLPCRKRSLIRTHWTQKSSGSSWRERGWTRGKATKTKMGQIKESREELSWKTDEKLIEIQFTNCIQNKNHRASSHKFDTNNRFFCDTKYILLFGSMDVRRKMYLHDSFYGFFVDKGKKFLSTKKTAAYFSFFA